MTIPSPSRLERWLSPFAGSRGVPIRVWGIETWASPTLPPTMEAEIFGSPPRLTCLGGGDDGLVVVRQTCDSLEDLDGMLVPWQHVVRLERDPHLVRDVVTVEVHGRPATRIAVSNHLLLPGNRAAAKALCDLVRRSSETRVAPPALDTRAAPLPSCNMPPRPAMGSA